MKNMVRLSGGVFLMGSDEFYPEERPAREVEVDGFWMDEHLVTVAEFRRFVKATDYLTLAERRPDASDYPDADPDLLVPGSLVFDPPDHVVDLQDSSNWWTGITVAKTRGAGQHATRTRAAPRHPCRSGGRRGVRDVDGKDPADRS